MAAYRIPKTLLSNDDSLNPFPSFRYNVSVSRKIFGFGLMIDTNPLATDVDRSFTLNLKLFWLSAWLIKFKYPKLKFEELVKQSSGKESSLKKV